MNWKSMDIEQKLNYLYKALSKIECCGGGGGGGSTAGSLSKVLYFIVGTSGRITTLDPYGTVNTTYPSGGDTTYTNTELGNYDYIQVEKNGQGALVEGVDFHRASGGDDIVLDNGFTFEPGEIYFIRLYTNA